VLSKVPNVRGYILFKPVPFSSCIILKPPPFPFFFFEDACQRPEPSSSTGPALSYGAWKEERKKKESDQGSNQSFRSKGLPSRIVQQGYSTAYQYPVPIQVVCPKEIHPRPYNYCNTTDKPPPAFPAELVKSPLLVHDKLIPPTQIEHVRGPTSPVSSTDSG